VHPAPSCLEKGARGLMKSARRAVSVEGEGPSARVLAKLVEQAFQRRIEGLLVAARRARKIVVGSDATVTSLRSGRGKLVLLAGDAAAAAKLGEVRFEINEGRAVAFGDKLSLGALVRPAITGKTDDGSPADPPSVAVLAVEDVRLAAALREAVHVLDTVRGVGAGPAKVHPKGGRAAKAPQTADSTSNAEAPIAAAERVPRGATDDGRNFDDGAAERRASGSAATAEQTTAGPPRSADHVSERRGSKSRLANPETDSPGSNDEPEGVPGAGPGTGGVERGA
jgi:ribosomal protein L7Ae-like RNA K-turn-binding protein